HWVKPMLVGQFKLKAMPETRAGKKRHPVIFLGIREDKDPYEIVADGEQPIKKSKTKTGTKRKAQKFDEIAVWKTIHPEEEVQETAELEVEGEKIIVINPNFPYWVGNT